MGSTILIILVVLVLILLWVVALYNGLVKLKNRVEEAWSDIDVQLKRRYDLIPNLIETVKGYAKHERETLENVIKARNMAMQGHDSNASLKDQAENENMLSGALKTIFALSESYPDLKANENFAKLQDELTDTENKIQAARRFYNGMVRDFNIKIQTFPNNLFMGILNYEAKEFFEAKGEEKEVVKVSF